MSRLATTKTITGIELFAGAGGLGMGFSNAGVDHSAVVEWNAHACQTLRDNKQAGVPPLAHWPEVTQGDVRDFDFGSLGEVDLVTGGPPCQPFSMGGKHGAYLDPRDMFPEAIRAVREIRPRAFVFENVKGLTRAAFSNYVAYIMLQLQYPSIVEEPGEPWLHHLGRLEMARTGGVPAEYNVVQRLVNAADYGVPQKRERVFFVGFRHDMPREWTFPEATHSLEALLYAQWVDGSYWDEHGVAPALRPAAPHKLLKKIEQLRVLGPGPLERWSTLRDALRGLPDPTQPGVNIPGHIHQPGARSYPGHTGSPLDEPAKALKAGDHGVPGGENMIRFADGSVRYLTVRESMRVQTFPDTMVINSPWGESMRQLGNAVPVKLAQAIAESVCTLLRAN